MYHKWKKLNYLFSFRDAPEPTGEETEDVDMELPKIYEPIPSLEALKERLHFFLNMYNDIVRGSGMDLVFFEDAMIHIVKVKYEKR